MKTNKSINPAFEYLANQINAVLETLPELEREVVISRFGLRDGISNSYNVLARKYNLAVQDVINIEESVLRKLRHPKC